MSRSPSFTWAEQADLAADDAAPAAGRASPARAGWTGLLPALVLPALGLLVMVCLALLLPGAYRVLVPAAALAGGAGWLLGRAGAARMRAENKADTDAADAGTAQATALLRALAEVSDDGLMAKDLDGRYVVFNAAAQVFTGSPAHAGVGSDAAALFGPARAARIKAMDRRIMVTGRTERCLQPVDTASGRRIYRVTKGPLRDAAGQLLGVYGLAQDVTQQQSEQALLVQLQHVAELCPQRILVTTIEGQVVFANAAALAAAGRPAEAVLGADWRPELALGLPGGDVEALWSQLRAGRRWRGLLQGTARDGQPRTEQALFSTLGPAGGEPSHVVAVLQDITGQQALEAALAQQGQLLDALAARHSAELSRDRLPAAAATGPTQPAGTTFATRALVESCCDELRALAAAQRVQIQMDIDAALPATMQGDALQLHALLQRLLTHAITACTGLARAGRVRVQAEPAGPARWRLSVADNGAGMDAAAEARLFTPCTEGGGAAPTADPRSLAALRRQVEALGGSLDVFSVPQAGSLFALTLPMHAMDASKER